jgi:AraC-like DNA-binding protein
MGDADHRRRRVHASAYQSATRLIVHDLDAAASLAHFAASPHGCWVSGPSFVYAWPTETLCVTALFGTPTRESVESLVRLFALELHSPAVPHASLIDARRVERIGPAEYDVLVRYVERASQMMTRYVTRLALVRPEGFVGAVTAGFYETLPPPYPIGVFSDAAEAFAWVDGERCERTLDELVARAGALPDFQRDLRRAVEARLPEVSLSTVAQDLGLAVRTLQRRLRECETTFRREVVAVQVAEAERRLLGTDDPVAEIAFDVGCGNPQYLSAIFRQATGLSPTEWRARRRAG